MSYNPNLFEFDDYLLLDEHSRVVAVSGNSDFWDMPEVMPEIPVDGTYMIVKVIEVVKDGKIIQ